MMSSTFIFQVSHRLIKTFGCLYKKTFAELQVNVCCDLYELPLVKGFPIQERTSSVKGLSSSGSMEEL